MSVNVTPIIKTVEYFCNLRCTYCFYHTLDQMTPRIISQDVVDQVVNKFLRYGDQSQPITFIWHGGEPLLAGLDFFSEVIRLQSRHNVNNRRIKNVIQTNGILLNDEWGRWFAKHDFQVGISIDGTKVLNDAYRVDVSGKGSWAKAVRGLKILRKYNVKHGALMVVHSESIGYGKESIYELYKQGVESIGFNLYFEPNPKRNHSDSSNLFISPSQSLTFFQSVVDAWLDVDDCEFPIREIENIVSGLLQKRPSTCMYNGSCATFFSIHANGDVYPCGRIPATEDVYMGNIITDDVDKIMSSSNYENFRQRVLNRPDECANCEILAYCNNGCTHHRVKGKYYFCETRKGLYNYLEKQIGCQLYSLMKMNN